MDSRPDRRPDAVSQAGELSLVAMERAAQAWGCATTWHWQVYGEVATTMVLAREELWRQSTGGVAVVADRQTAGRGRRGHGWESPSGVGLYLSLAWRPDDFGSLREGALTLRVGLAACRGIQRVTGAVLGLKWPNDGMWQEQKCMGVLCEAGAQPEPWVVAGIGVNVAGRSAPLAGATSLEAITGTVWPRPTLAAAIARAVEEVRSGRDRDEWLAAYRERCDGVTLHRRVRVMGAGEPSYEGIAERVDAEGGLWVRRDFGPPVRVTAGEVSIRTR